jgi:N-acetyl-alpha-D-glucosaminyl L-malate synthase BshA
MKIGIVCYPTFGGSGVVATELGKALADNGHQVHFITYNQPARLDFFSENLFYHEVSVSKYPLFDYPPYELALASRLVDVVRFEMLDILHVHYAIPHASAAFMAKQILMTYGIYIPVVTTLHGTDITLVGKDRTYKPVVTFSINKSDGVTAVSENLRKDTYEFFDIENDIKVIPNFVDLKRFSLQAKDHFKRAIAPEGEKILVHTSNFRKVKRTEDVVRIFAKILEKIPSKLLMVGDGGERSDCEQLCRDLGVGDDVRFLGKQDAIEEILSVSDLFLMPSQSESFGLAALDGVTGFLKDVGDVQGMADSAIYILEDEARLTTFKENALARAKEFDLAKILPIYENYYVEVIEKTRAQAAGCAKA